MKTLATLSVVIFALIFTGCDETKKVIDVAGNVQLTGSYTVSAIDGQKLKVANNPSFTLSAIDNSVQGNTGCNSIYGSYNLDLYAITFNDIAVTAKNCTEKNSMEIERQFLDALNNNGSYGLEGNTLTLYSKNDRSALLTATKDKNRN